MEHEEECRRDVQLNPIVLLPPSEEEAAYQATLEAVFQCALEESRREEDAN